MEPKPKKYPELNFDCTLPVELHLLLDPPPVTNSDDVASHQLIFMGLAHVVNPRDFIEWLIVRDMADHRYEITWGRRLMAGLVRRERKNYKVRELFELFKPYEDERNKLNDTVRADLEKQIRQLKGESEKLKRRLNGFKRKQKPAVWNMIRNLELKPRKSGLLCSAQLMKN